jgi:hypothetical protein
MLMALQALWVLPDPLPPVDPLPLPLPLPVPVPLPLPDPLPVVPPPELVPPEVIPPEVVPPEERVEPVEPAAPPPQFMHENVSASTARAAGSLFHEDFMTPFSQEIAAKMARSQAWRVEIGTCTTSIWLTIRTGP